MAKINVVKHATETELDELISNISTFSNAQSRVSKVDLKARSMPMIKLKGLSDSVITPKGNKWFFERAKGELNTMIRKSGRKESILKKYPKERRFTKEELAKYYSAWGNSPYKVKKGGEKVFREFIEEITGETKAKPPAINRYFYENLIAKIILFRSLERSYAEEKIGNIRAAVIPYSISVLYNLTDGSDSGRVFDLSRIWLDEGLDQNLTDYLIRLMGLMNALIKKYAKGDDPSEESKTLEMWEKIMSSNEIKQFCDSADSRKIYNKYTISAEEQKKRLSKVKNSSEVNFQNLHENILIHANGFKFYQELQEQFSGFTHLERERITGIRDIIYKRNDLSSTQIDQEKAIINKVLVNDPEIFDRIDVNTEVALPDTLDYVISTYNEAISKSVDIESVFNTIASRAEIEKIKDAEVWRVIGNKLSKGESPTVAEIYACSNLLLQRVESQSVNKAPVIDSDLVKNMVEWDSKNLVLSAAERQYLTDFAYGFKSINSFHANNIKRHLQKISEAGYIR